MSDFGSLRGQRILVTGSSTGIGRAIARECAAAGADVILHGRVDSPELRQTERDVSSLGRRTQVLVRDLSPLGAGDELAAAAWRVWDGLDGAACNAGVDLLTGDAPLLTFSAKLQRLLDVDVRSTIDLCRALGNAMQQHGGGALLTLGWDQADRGMEGDSAQLFSAAKNAVMGFTRSLAVSLAPNVRVNCVAPGWIRTDWGAGAGEEWQQRVIRETPLRRWGAPEDIARLARFLLSADAGYLTGQIINANGGAVR